jgi:Methyltransferase FkbM domain
MTPVDRYEIGDVRFVLRDPDASVVRESVPGHGYEPAVTAILRALLRRGDACFVDIGSLYGYFALYAAKLNPACRVHAVEPHPDYFEVLTANVAANGVDVRCHPVALADRPGLVPMRGKALQGHRPRRGGSLRTMAAGVVQSVRRAGGATAPGLRLGPGGGGGEELGHAISLREWCREGLRQAARSIAGTGRPSAVVPAIRYDDWASEGGIRPAVAKIDVHGAEGLVLAGMPRALSNDIESLLVEIHSPRMMIECEPADVLDMLSAAGFALYEVLDFRRSTSPVLRPLKGDSYSEFGDPGTWTLGDLSLMRMIFATKHGGLGEELGSL